MTAATANVSTAPTLARRAYHIARHMPDRMLHQRRHRNLLRRLSAGTTPKTILVVCYGNVCRSPYLAAVLKRALPDATLLSAGFLPGGRRVPDAALEVSTARGHDLSAFRSSAISAEMVDRAELIIVMDARQAAGLAVRFPSARSRLVVAGDLDPVFENTRAIRDPWNESPEIFEAAFDRLDRCAASLAKSLHHGG
ncbi:MAG TPA: hypothetical protein VJS39_09845 [Gemmatimonadaceae bacterium]|nr:hypothetical protein [Gemmatimonadaceae bacterium]